MADYYHSTLAQLAGRSTDAPAEQLPRLRKLLEKVLRDEYRRDERSFTDLSQAIGAVVYQRGLGPSLRYRLHALRLAANLVLHESYAGTPAEVAAGFAAVVELVEKLGGQPYAGPRLHPELVGAEPPIPAEATALPPEVSPQPLTAALSRAAARPTNVQAPAPDAEAGPSWALWRVQVLAVDEVAGELLVEADEAGGLRHVASTGLPVGPFKVLVPEAYASLLPLAAILHPVLHLIGPVRRPDGRVQPRRLVLEPDYLVNVTTIAECAQQDGTIPEWALQKAFQPEDVSRPLVLGNLVNALLDEEVSHATRQTDFEIDEFLKKRLFRLAPLALSTLPELQTRTGVPELLNDLRRHHRTLRETREQGFVARSRTGYQQEPLRPADCALEPTFLSATYGLQGRLDLLHESPAGYDLVELKSSTKVPFAQPWANHAAQAQLYRLLLESVYGGEEASLRGRTSILYSNAASGQPAVRRVDSDPALVDALLAARNQLVGTELALARASGPAQVARLLAPVLRPDLGRLPSFGREKAQRVAGAWGAADPTERAYALELTRFVAREMRLTLLGEDSRPGDTGGQAGLWRLPPARKQQNFSLLDELLLVENNAGLDDDFGTGLGPHLVLQRAADSREVNFRAGDTLLLYPCRKREAEQASSPAAAARLTVLDAQVVKVVLAEDLGADGRVVVSVRNRQLAPRYLQAHARWALEPDTYDTFRREWAHLSAFLALPKDRRQRLLGRRSGGPRPPEDWTPGAAPATTAEEVLSRALAAPDWFVLCGPPGTGKTRGVLRELAARLYKQDKHVLLAAYTNRAVDEICEQLVEAGLPFIRVGSRLGTAPTYRPYLLDHMLRDCVNRQAVRDRLGNCPFYVGTVAALLGKPELFQLKEFDLAVVDEASQVLEAPMLALLARVPRFILIGDHRQLPAVVAQDAQVSAVSGEVAELLREELGLTNLRNSYFERLFRRAEQFWPHAHGTLADQYRMHEELAALVNDDFYGGQLRCPKPWQQQPLNRADWPAPAAGDALAQALRRQRLLWLPTRRAPADASMKESIQEADLAARAAAELARGYGAAFDPAQTLGIIASYRNQAALIRARLAQLAAELDLPALAQVSVDTVERYQGSQREVIIVSFCCHHEHQLELLVSPDDAGQVDRKLNVALTRARQQLVLLGNEQILGQAPHHAGVLARVRAAGGVVGGF